MLRSKQTQSKQEITAASAEPLPTDTATIEKEIVTVTTNNTIEPLSEPIVPITPKIINKIEPSVLDTSVTTEFLPTTRSESTNFLLPEDQISVEILRKQTDNNIKEFVYQHTPQYISESYDAYSKNYCTINIGKNLSTTVDLVRYNNHNIDNNNIKTKDIKENNIDTPESPSPYISNNNDDNNIEEQRTPYQITETSHQHTKHSLYSNKNILQAYSPSLTTWYSTYRNIPNRENVQLLSGRIATDSNLLLKIMKLQMRQKVYEPLFGSITLYTIIDDEIYRISESFHYDLSTEAMRKYYGTCYIDQEGIDIHPYATKNYDFSGNCINIGDGSSERNHYNMCHITIPEELSYTNLYLIVQINKIMSCDSEKATLPYYSRQLPPDMLKNKESCERLNKYRQPIGLGILKLSDDNGKLIGRASSGEVVIPMYCQKTCLSDPQIHMVRFEYFVYVFIECFCMLCMIYMSLNVNIVFIYCYYYYYYHDYYY